MKKISKYCYIEVKLADELHREVLRGDVPRDKMCRFIKEITSICMCWLEKP